ncbi:hypothetical protein NLX83_13215 [Allokutzneria sp. A3M-2-11 16]|uniref:hypothetical protein n=1 Tax=Allokutzneria sp. A3M-2-11 16 TaxID=2962043 RepID=UPI0020B6751D|nr:hypothetical protein [Allokutzneria sp. A3M-2-11 16]MCP3800219.1 hypothetical protein [Allokutzneria sp. A3M-2-11 16]
MSQGEVGDRVRATADTVQAARAQVLAAHELAADARDGLAVAMDGSRPEHHAGVVGALSDTVSAIGDAAEYAEALSAALNGFADRLGTRGAGTVPATPAAVSEPARSVAATAPAPGKWKGKTAKEHVLNGGEVIGRKPRGSKSMPIRLVDSVAELNEIFAALHVGAEREHIPSYKGQMWKFPDGTRIAYRTSSRSGGDNDPTMDLAVPGKKKTTLKVHVSHEEQDGTP